MLNELSWWRAMPIGVSCLLHVGLVTGLILGQQWVTSVVALQPPVLPVELVTLRLVAQGIPERLRIPDRVELPLALAAGGSRPVYFGPEHGRLTTPILRRADLVTPRVGPCIVEEYDATCVIPPDARAQLDDYGNIAIEVTP